MSALTVARRGRLAGAIVPAAALAVAGIVVAATSAQAASRVPALHAGSKVALGSTTNFFSQVFTQAQDGTLFYSQGSAVSAEKGTAKPKTVLHAAHTVQALAATSSDLFVQTGLTVTEYRRSNFKAVKHFTVSSPVKPITTAGLIAGSGNTLWSWTDWATDGSGFEFATVSRINTATSSVKVVSKVAYPGGVANSNGLYFQSNQPTGNYLNLATAGGALHKTKAALAEGSPMALDGSNLELLGFASHVTILTYSSSLTLMSSKQVNEGLYNIGSASLGLVAIGQNCNACSTSTVSKLNPATGATSGGIHLNNAQLLVSGPNAAVIEVAHVTHGAVTLQRISS